MPIDTSMYNQNPVNTGLDAFSNTLKLSDMVRQAREHQAVKQAFSDNVTTDPQGNPQINQAGLLSSLAKASPQTFMEVQSQMASQAKAQRESQLAQLQLHSQQLQFTGQVASGIKNQNDYDRGLQTLKANGIDVSDAPAQYDPNWVNFHAGAALSAKEKIDQAMKNKEFGLKQTEANAKTLEARAKAADAGLPFDQTAGYGGIGGSPGGGSAVPALSGGGAGQNTVASNGPGGAAGQPDALLDVDPATLLSRVPSKDREKVAAQIDAAKNSVQNGPLILKHFNDAYDKGHVVNFIPGVHNADQKAFEALMGPTFADIEHTVRQAAMENMFKNTMPAPMRDKIEQGARETKQSAVEDYLKYKTSASLAKNYGIDLSKYKATNVKAALDASGKAAGDMATVQLPDGRTGSIPRSNLSKAISMGAKEIQ